MSASLARPLRSLQPVARRFARAASTAPSAPSSSDSNTPAPPPPSSSTAAASSNIPQHPPLHRPAFTVPFTPVPRMPNFPNAEDQPLVQHYNHPLPLLSKVPLEDRPEVIREQDEQMTFAKLSAMTGYTVPTLQSLNRYTARVTRVVNMTKKGKMPSMQAYMIVGSAEDGLVGFGRGKGINAGVATSRAFVRAVMNMDYVNRYEGRTLWGEGKDLESKWGASKVTLRARPPGFGLMVPPMIHRVLSACGIKDASAMITGSNNRPEIIKATIQILHGGGNPLGFGTGLAKLKGPRENKGRGMRSKDEIERERGRYGVDIGRKV
ncbi:hypothetical protein IAT38_003320 [Cryptococcus sp. DSM 104549]